MFEERAEEVYQRAQRSANRIEAIEGSVAGDGVRAGDWLRRDEGERAVVKGRLGELEAVSQFLVESSREIRKVERGVEGVSAG